MDDHDPTGAPSRALRPRALDDVVVAIYFLAGPALLALDRFAGVDPLELGDGWWPLVVYGLVAPLVGVLVWLAAPRARFAAYVFLSVEILRAAVQHRYAALGLAAAVLLYLQTPRMRARYPTLDARAMIRRWRTRR